MMVLSKSQCEWIEKERKDLRRIIESEPKYGLFNYHARLSALDAIVELHNVEMKNQVKVIKELKNGKEKNQSN